MKKDLLSLHIVILIVLLFPSRGLAQSGEPSIKEISPSQIPTNEKTVISIQGQNLTDPLSITISNGDYQIFLSHTLVSTEEITATLPALDAGAHTLCVRFTNFRDCRELSFIAAKLSVISIAPAQIYNPVENNVSIVLTHGPEIAKMFLNDVELEISSITRDVTNDTDQITVIVPPGGQVGSMEFVAQLADGQRVTIDSPIIVKGSIDAHIDDISPNVVRRYSTSQNELVIHGKNFEGIDSILWSPVVTCYFMTSCDEVSVTSSEIRISISNPSYTFENPVSSGTISFLDGSEISLGGKLSVIDPVFPWDSRSAIWSTLFLLILAVAWPISYYVSFSFDHDRFKLNQTAPGVGHSLVVVATMVGQVFVTGAVALGIWYLFSTVSASIVYMVSIALITVNLLSAFTFMDMSRKFGRFIPGITLFIFVTAVIVLAIGLPILFTYLQNTQLSLISSSVLFVLVVVAGVSSVRYTRIRLESQKVKGPSETEIYNRVEEDIFRRGQLVATSDYKELPQDRVLSALSKFFTDNKDRLSLEFSPSDGSLKFVRFENIKTIHAAFETLRARLKQGKEWSSEDVGRLEQALRKEFGFKVGKGLQKIKKSNPFFVFGLKPTGAESILPDPFPLIVFASNQVISPAEMDELQDVLNQLDTKNRFAVLVVINEGAAVRETIQQRFRGIGKENLVVLAEKDCKEIIGSTDSLRLAFMKIIQNQVDLLVFKPYSVEGATPVDMFYGRKQEINSVLERTPNGSVAVLGARRIGKTSMLQASKRILEERGKLVLYLDCYEIYDYSTLLQRINLDWAIHGAPKNVLKTLNDFPAWLAELQRANPKKQLIFLLDEIDGLINYDQKQKQQEKLFRMFRSLAQESRCQFIFSGERLILEQLSNPKSPFFNFVSPIQLGLFDIETTRNIVVEPMRLIGITIHGDQEIVKAIAEYSNGSPSLIQSICLQALKDMNKRKIKILDLKTIKKVIEGELDDDKQAEAQSYRDRYLETFWSQASPFEKAISIVVAEAQPIRISEIHTRLRNYGFKSSIEELRKGIRYLILCQLLVANKDQYEIKPVKFNEMLSIFSYSQWIEEFS